MRAPDGISQIAMKDSNLTPVLVLRGYFYSYLVINLVLSVSLLALFKTDQKLICEYSDSTFFVMRNIRYLVPSIWTKISLYETFRQKPVDVCFLFGMYDAIIIISIVVSMLCSMIVIRQKTNLNVDKLKHIAIFTVIAVGGLCIGGVNEIRIGIVQLTYDRNGIFIIKETFYYMLIAGLIGNLIGNAVIIVDRMRHNKK